MSETHPIVSRAQAVAAEIAERGAELEAAGCLPRDVLDKLIEAGFIRMMLPAEYGGDPVSLWTTFEVLEALARGDGSVAWVTMIYCETPPIFARLPRATFERLYAETPDLIAAGGFAPKGRAEVSEGGYRVTGRWAFGTGCQHAAYLMGHCVVTEGGTPLPGMVEGSPRFRLIVVPAEQATIHDDTWHVSGLRGTGSHDISFDDVFVPEEMTCDLFGPIPSNVPGHLLELPATPIFVLHMAAVALGIAQGALDDVVTIAKDKQRLYAKSTIASNAVFHNRIGRTALALDAARNLLREQIDAYAPAAATGHGWSVEYLARCRAVTSWVAQTAAQAVDTAYTEGGGAALYDRSPLQRRLRDVHALTQHAALADDAITQFGGMLAGQGVTPPL